MSRRNAHNGGSGSDLRVRSRSQSHSAPERQLPKCYDLNAQPNAETGRALWLSLGSDAVDFQNEDIDDEWFFEWKNKTWATLQFKIDTRTRPEVVEATFGALCAFLRRQGGWILERTFSSRAEFCRDLVSLFSPSVPINLSLMPV